MMCARHAEPRKVGTYTNMFPFGYLPLTVR